MRTLPERRARNTRNWAAAGHRGRTESEQAASARVRIGAWNRLGNRTSAWVNPFNRPTPPKLDEERTRELHSNHERGVRSRSVAGVSPESDRPLETGWGEARTPQDGSQLDPRGVGVQPAVGAVVGGDDPTKPSGSDQT